MKLVKGKPYVILRDFSLQFWEKALYIYVYMLGCVSTSFFMWTWVHNPSDGHCIHFT